MNLLKKLFGMGCEEKPFYHFSLERLTGMDEKVIVQFNGLKEETYKQLADRVNMIGDIVAERFKYHNKIAQDVAEKIKTNRTNEIPQHLMQ